MNYWLLLIPVLTVISTWLVLKLTVFFIFLPNYPWRFAGMSIQGWLPKNRSRIIEHISQFLVRQISLSTRENNNPADPALFASLKPVLEAHMDDFLRNRLKTEMPVVGTFIGEKTLTSLKQLFIREIESVFPLLLEKLSSHSTGLEEVVHARIKTLPFDQMESSLLKQAWRELARYEIWACGLGFVIGMIQLAILVWLR